MSSALLLLPIILMGVVGFLYWFERKMLFAPRNYRDASLLHQYPLAFNPVTLQLENGMTLEGMVYEPEESYQQSMLYFGGKLQDSVGVLPKLAQAYPNTRIITFNYRGYGKSQGKPSQATLYHDALAIYDYVHEHYQVNGVLGYSLGSAVASFLGSKRSLQWLVLIAAFDSIQALSKYHYKMHLSVLARHPFETYKHVQSITTPLYLFASKDDNIVPIYNARRLRNNVKNLRVYKEFSGYNHDEILLSDAVVCALKEELEL